MAVRIAICNRKGGTGKSTVSVNLAAGLAQQGLRVLVLDMDSQSHCAAGLGVPVRPPYLHDIFRRSDITLSDAIRTSDFPGLSLAPADPNFDHGMAGADQLLLSHHLASESLDSQYDVILIDTPPSQDQLLMNALMAAHWVIVPFVPHFLSYQGIKQLIRLMHGIKTTENPQLQLAGFLPTMASTTMRHHKKIMEEVGRHFGKDRILPAIRTDIRVADAFATGQPVIGFAPRSRAAEDFSQLSRCISERLQEQAH
ncbi:ParA family protein [uncultured Thalassolituus sp.]|uniref:ParA family protein n=1 Tax=uncultured Thalassolituus sp. TaxID=285273 RepID=UPI00260B2801|nr:ParA family protein [uncultured Thalassolituus sp.]